MLVGIVPFAMISGTQDMASAGVLKRTRRSDFAFGSPMSLMMAVVTMPRVPSEPTMRWVRS